MALTDKLTAIADGFRASRGTDEKYTLAQMAAMAAEPAGSSLNFSVVGGTSEPSFPMENTIWINTDVGIAEWATAAKNPFVELRDVDLVEQANATATSGYITSNGGVSAATAGEKEVYITTYFPVKYGTTYTYEHTLAASNSMWFAIAEYTGSYTFKQRLVKVNYVAGTSQSGTYTPSSSDVTAVRLTWSSYGVASSAKLVESDVPVTIDGTKEGAVWISTGTSSGVAFNALSAGCIMVYPVSASQFINGAWVDKEAKSYQNGKWESWLFYWLGGGSLKGSIVSVNNASFTDGKIVTTGTGWNTSAFAIDEPHDLTGVKKINMTILVSSMNGSYPPKFGIKREPSVPAVWDNRGFVTESTIWETGATFETYSLELNGAYSGNYYFCFAGVSECVISDIWVEK